MSDVTVFPTTDVKVLDRALKHPAIRDRVVPDDMMWKLFSGAQMMAVPGTVCLEVQRDAAPGGCFVFFQKPDETYAMHTLLLPECRGAAALTAGHKAIDWMKANCSMKHLVSDVPESIPEAKWYARRLGFKVTGRTSASWQKNGRKYDTLQVELQ